MNVAIRRARAEDLPEVVGLVAEYCAADGHEFDEARTRSAVEPLLADDHHGGIWVAEVDGRVDGYGTITWGWSIEAGGAEAVLDELYVRTRGGGVGSALIVALETDARDHGMRRILLETELPNHRARRLYERHGYRPDDSIWMSKWLA